MSKSSAPNWHGIKTNLKCEGEMRFGIVAEGGRCAKAVELESIQEARRYAIKLADRLDCRVRVLVDGVKVYTAQPINDRLDAQAQAFGELI